MKARHIFSLAFLVCSCASLQATPVLTAEDTSEKTLSRDFATPEQQKSLERYKQARLRADNKRSQETEEIQRITEKNNQGIKRRIQQRLLDSMLPACEREPLLNRN
ncbi:MAG: hypothetical protein LUG84_09270 [Akkermansiaceae bacterium]|nr:hypothetical protein [Akkermansia sp.]MCD7799571.1 hypothetical protein [Akkermansiaceae bacterium]MCD8070970.1 hypothetical protein [Akkermansiaceae bacterium]